MSNHNVVINFALLVLWVKGRSSFSSSSSPVYMHISLSKRRKWKCIGNSCVRNNLRL